MQLPVVELCQKIKEGTLSPEKIDLGPNFKKLEKSWKTVLAEKMAQLIIGDRNLQTNQEIKEVLLKIRE